MPVKAILLVEDSAADVYLVQRAIEECDLKIQLWTRDDGLEALQFLRKEPPLTHVPTPALIIIDLVLPLMRGTELIAAIRQLPAYQQTPIVILSRLDKAREEAACLQLGANAYVQKSLADFAAYFASIKALLKYWLRSAASG